MSVTAVPGFIAGGFDCGIKPTQSDDLAVVIAERPVPTAGVYTKNTAAAAPVIWSRRQLKQTKTAQAILLNSGCANAGTGAPGRIATEANAQTLADILGCPANQIQVCSTGPIGEFLPYQKINRALPQLVGVASAEGGQLAAEAIMTTDRTPKTSTVEGDGFVVGGMAKGAGMIRPDMATMLAVLTTDAKEGSSTLQMILEAAVRETFNCLNIDGCESTNDTVLLMSSGLGSDRRYTELTRAVFEVCDQLAQMIAADAEGATKMVTIHLNGASYDGRAQEMARAIADSVLVRAAFYGNDPNWGRILAALGSTHQEFDFMEVSISIAGTPLFQYGQPVEYDLETVSEAMQSDFEVVVVVGTDNGNATVRTTDLTPEYVQFNGARS